MPYFHATERLSARQISLSFLAFFPLSKLFYLPALLSARIENDLWIPLLFGFFLDGLLLLLLLFASKRGATFPKVLYDAFGKPLGKGILLLYALFFLCKSFLFFGEERMFVQTELFETVPFFIFFLPVLLVGWFFCTRKAVVLGRCADIFFFVSLLSLGALAFLALPQAKWQALLPVAFRRGQSLLSAVEYILPYFGDPLVFFFLLGAFRLKKGDGAKIWGGFFLSAAVTTLFFALFYAVFTTVGRFESAAFFNIAKFRVALSAVGRVDLLFSYAICATTGVALSVWGYTATLALSACFGVKNKTLLGGIFFLLLALCSLLLFSRFMGVAEALRRYGAWVSVVFSYLLPAYALLVFWIKSRAKRKAGAGGFSTLPLSFPLRKRGGEAK